MLAAHAPFSLRKDAKVVTTFDVSGEKSEPARFPLHQERDHKGHRH